MHFWSSAEERPYYLSSSTAEKLRDPVITEVKMLRFARMAAMRKLHRGEG